jgi:hypothetical protein
MALSNIEQFQIDVLRAIAALYKSHPQTIDLDNSILSGNPPGTRPMPDHPTAHGSLKWMIDNGIVRGNFQESRPMNGPGFGIVIGAQLTASALRTLQKPELEAAGTVLGEFIVLSENTPSEQRAAQVLGSRMLGS